MSTLENVIALMSIEPYSIAMFIIFGIIFGLAWGIFHGRRLSEDKNDRIMYAGSYTLVGFTIGVILTLLIGFLA